jgi:hypothetical protein
VTVIHLPEEQKPFEEELKMEIRFSKGKSDVLTFKNKKNFGFFCRKPSQNVKLPSKKKSEN